MKLPEYIIGSLEDSGIKYVPYVLLALLCVLWAGSCYVGVGLILTGSVGEMVVPAKRKHEALALKCPFNLPSSPSSAQALPSDTLHNAYPRDWEDWLGAHKYLRSFLELWKHGAVSCSFPVRLLVK